MVRKILLLLISTAMGFPFSMDSVQAQSLFQLGTRTGLLLSGTSIQGIVGSGNAEEFGKSAFNGFKNLSFEAGKGFDIARRTVDIRYYGNLTKNDQAESVGYSSVRT